MKYRTECSNRSCSLFGSSTGNITIEQWQRFFDGKNNGPLRKGDRQQTRELVCIACSDPIGVTLEGEGFISEAESAAMLATAIADNERYGF